MYRHSRACEHETHLDETQILNMHFLALSRERKVPELPRIRFDVRSRYHARPLSLALRTGALNVLTLVADWSHHLGVWFLGYNGCMLSLRLS